MLIAFVWKNIASAIANKAANDFTENKARKHQFFRVLMNNVVFIYLVFLGFLVK